VGVCGWVGGWVGEWVLCMPDSVCVCVFVEEEMVCVQGERVFFGGGIEVLGQHQLGIRQKETARDVILPTTSADDTEE
jgi:hypothetical protein